MLKDLDQDNPVTPAEKPTFRKSRASRKPTRCCDMCTCTCPAMALNSSALKPIQKPNANVNKEQKSKICPRLLRHSKTIETTTDNSANVVGGGGGGNGVGGVGVNIKMPDNSGVELVPLLARRRAFERPISLSTTDVTKRTASNDRYASKLKLNMNNNNNINNHNHNHNRNNLRNHNNSNIKNTNCTNTTTTTSTCCLKKFTLHIR